MTLLVIVLLVVGGFFWMFSRSVTAGYGKFLFSLLGIIGVLCLLLAVPHSPTPTSRAVFNVVGWVIIALPFLWLGRRMYVQYWRGR